MKRKKLIMDNHRIIVDEINYYYPRNIENKRKAQLEYRIYIEFTNRERLVLKFPSSEIRDDVLNQIDLEFD